MLYNIQQNTYKHDDAGYNTGFRDDPDAPGKVALYNRRYDGAHERDAEPGVVKCRQGGAVAIAIDVDIKRSLGNKYALYPFVDEDCVYYRPLVSETPLGKQRCGKT